MNAVRDLVLSVSISNLPCLTAALLVGCSLMGQALPAQEPSAAKEVPQSKPTKTLPALPTPAQRLAKARMKASRENKRILVLGGTVDEATGKTLQVLLKRDRKVGRTMRYEYELLTAPTQGGLELRILDAKGKEVSKKAAEAFLSEDRIVAQKLDAWLQEHKAPPLHARKVLAEALALAKAREKNVFVHLGAPW